ncbi:helix-turn-helix domain-containing protein [Neobacillus sp. OS1-33]|jgi:DNA-directed RNA polymerase specialized sigma subunit|uniref:helix-turn-helix domain-containing protein n=1 Tax=Neobacillus sp. OS1-33 TaxID=3070683 RepID=UPI0027E15D84|nr:helix-turn-helix domain-containing protein [Neobacillus sp. OS1-33]WML27377.1 helix-turn-helix domain-containing protein [Neobacillus sp. OS1-33]
MEKTLYQLAIKSKEDNEAIEKVLKIFKPKIKKTLLQTGLQNRDDLEQELQIKLVNLIKMYDLDKVVGFWEFQEMVQNKIS